MAKSSLGKFLTRVRIAVGTILLAIVLVALAVHFSAPPTQTPTTPPTPTGLPTASLYLAEFRSHRELFISHTKILHILFQDESGNRLGNLSSVYEVKRDGYTVYLNINHSFRKMRY